MFVEHYQDLLSKDKNLYFVPEFSVVTVYDDNYYLRNDYDMLSQGQRNYLINFFKKSGLRQKSGKLMTDDYINIHFPKPNHNLALSSYDPKYNLGPVSDVYAVTPSTFAEVIFFESLNNGIDWGVDQLKSLIQNIL